MSEIKYIEPQQEVQLYNDVCQIIDGARGRIATYVNTEACMTNWHVGKRIKEDVLFNRRAEYGKQVVINLSIKLTERYGSGWSEKTLRHCLRAAETFSEEDILSATQRQLTWTHLKSLMYIKNPLERQFYAQMCISEHWDTRTLDEKIDKQLYITTALSRKPEEVIMASLQHPRIAFLCLIYHIVFHIVIDDAGNDSYHHQHYRHDTVSETLGKRTVSFHCAKIRFFSE